MAWTTAGSGSRDTPTDLRNAGVTWVDEEVVVDANLVSSRKADDLPAFCAAVVQQMAGGLVARKRSRAVPGVG